MTIIVTSVVQPSSCKSDIWYEITLLTARTMLGHSNPFPQMPRWFDRHRSSIPLYQIGCAEKASNNDQNVREWLWQHSNGQPNSIVRLANCSATLAGNSDYLQYLPRFVAESFHFGLWQWTALHQRFDLPIQVLVVHTVHHRFVCVHDDNSIPSAAVSRLG